MASLRTHNRGAAKRVYQSEAVGSIDIKYLLRVHEIVKEAEKTFAECRKK